MISCPAAPPKTGDMLLAEGTIRIVSLHPAAERGDMPIRRNNRCHLRSRSEELVPFSARTAPDPDAARIEVSTSHQGHFPRYVAAARRRKGGHAYSQKQSLLPPLPFRGACPLFRRARLPTRTRPALKFPLHMKVISRVTSPQPAAEKGGHAYSQKQSLLPPLPFRGACPLFRRARLPTRTRPASKFPPHMKSTPVDLVAFEANPRH